MNYLALLERLHAALKPGVYLEIGVALGDSLQISRSPSVVIDPNPQIRAEALIGKPWIKIYASTSNKFFQTHTAAETLEGARLDLAFIDGLHEFAQVVRDLEYVERWSHPETVVVLHDVLPRTAWEASRSFHHGAWTGDVWRVVPFLAEYRPDLRCWLTAADPSGVLIVTRLDPTQRGMAHVAASQDRTYPPDGAEYDHLVTAWLKQARVESPETVLLALTNALPHARPPEEAPGRESLWAGEPETLEAITHRGMRWLPESSWRPVLQTSIDAYYDGRHEEGLAACLRLLNAHGLPDDIRELTYRNRTYYARPLPELIADARWQMIQTPAAAGSASREPSPLMVRDRLLVLLRAMHEEEPTGTSDVLLTFDDELSTVEGVTIEDGTGEAARFAEARLFLADGAIKAAVIVRDPEGNGIDRAGVVDLSDGSWQHLRLIGPRTGGFRQGWSPLVTPRGPRFVGWWEPTETWRFEPEGGHFVRMALRIAPHVAERFEGGSQGVSVPGGYLFLVNERVAFDEGQPLVFSSFARIDEDFQLADVSPQFFVSARGQDVASGLARHGDQLIAGFTSGGSQALLATMNLDAALATLVPAEAPGRKRETRAAGSGPTGRQ